ncbi:MAG: hypothetical protein JNM84_23500, partial [Planctomycetes bacterium]|nr:hypothetical protein [Planctomycetota bacterium]
MSSHESFEFLAIDRLLTPEECEELRAVSTRAEISVASFRNEYQWGRLRADPHRLLEKYFDAFLHFGSWGVRELALRFPSSRLRWQDLRAYFVKEAGGLERSRGKLIAFWRREDEGARWEGEQLPPLALLAGVRAELLAGDLRAAYLAWLIAVHCGELPDEIEEPPVPPGLSKLSRPQRALADFFVLDADLLR